MEKNRLFILCDIIFVTFSLYFALLLKFDFAIESEYIQFFKYSIFPVIMFTLIYNKLFNLYNSLWKYASIEELMSVIYSVSIMNITFLIYSYFINFKLFSSTYYRLPLSVHLIFWTLCIISVGGIRFIYRIFYENLKNKNNCNKLKNVLIIGAGDAGVMIIKEIRNNKKLFYNIIGIIDDDETKIGKKINGIKVLGSRNEIAKICNENHIEEIIVSMPSAKNETKKEIFNVCKKIKCSLKTIPNMYDIIDNKIGLSKITNVSIEDLLGRQEIKLNLENINKYIKDNVILVTGGGGSIGSEICRQVAKFKPKKLLILDIYENNAYDLQMELNFNYPDINKEVIIASIRDEKRLQQIFSMYKPDVVFHAAAHKHVPLMEYNPYEAIKNNIIGTYNLVKLSDKFNVKKFVQISTDKAVNPTNVMGATKRFCEMIIQAFNGASNTEYVVVRFGNVLGSNGSVIPLFKKQIEKGGPVTVTHPEINRFFMTIPEAAQLVIQAGGMADGGEVFVLDMGRPVKIVDLAKDLITLSGLEPDIDIKIKYTGLRPGEKLYEELLMDELALTSTDHDKIFIEKPGDFYINFIEDSISEFKEAMNKDKGYIIELLSKKVPTFKHNNNY